MNYFGRIVNGIKGYYSEINSATLTGAIDIIVVRQADGSFLGSPFHVRFGKIGVLRSREKVVDISINDEPVDLHMKLGEGGEAFFVEPCEAEDVPHYLCTSPIPDMDSLMSEGIAKLKKEIKENEQQSSDSPIQNSATQTRSCSKHLNLDSDNDNESIGDSDSKTNDQALDTEEASFLKRSANISVPAKRSSHKSHQALNEFYPFSDLDSPITTPDQQSPSNTRPPSPQRYSSDTEVNYQGDQENGKSDGTNRATWNWGRLPEGLQGSTKERKPISELKKEAKKAKVKSSNKTSKAIGDGMYLDDLLFVDEEVAELYLQQNARSKDQTTKSSKNYTNTKYNSRTTKSESQLSEVQKSDSKITDENGKTVVDSIKSDSELSHSYERSSELENVVGKNDVTDGVKSDSEINKSDGESGLGSSVSVSPDESKLDENDQYTNIAISLCGELRRGKVSLEHFMDSSVNFEDFAKEPTQILSNPKLVIRIGHRYFNSSVAVPMLISYMVYQRPLPKNAVDVLVKEHMPKKAKRRGYSSWFSWRSPPEHNESTDEDMPEAEREQWQDESLDETDNLRQVETPEPMPDITLTDNNGEIELTMTSSETTTTETFKKVLELSSEQLASLNLKEGANEVTFSVTTKYQGTASCSASIFLYNYDDKIIISDIDGTITKSDVLGQILPASFWAQSGVAKLFSTIEKNGYKFMYLSARPIGQAELTRTHLKNVVQENLGLPDGPLFLSPSSLIKAFHREVIEKRPQDFKIPCLRNIRKLFPSKNDHEPFYAGFGNRMNDVLSYRAVGIPVHRIFTINHKGEVTNERTNAFQSSYTAMQDVVDEMFPPYKGSIILAAADEFSEFTFWRTQPPLIEDTPSEPTPPAPVAKATA